MIKKRIINKKTLIFFTCVLCGIFLMFGINYRDSAPCLSPELKAWEKLAEEGDTVALHKLLNYYNDNSEIYVEVVEAIDADGNEIELNEINEGSYDDSLNELYLDRLHYWLNKGLAINDPVAKLIT